jgi:hypothetical protein
VILPIHNSKPATQPSRRQGHSIQSFAQADPPDGQGIAPTGAATSGVRPFVSELASDPVPLPRTFYPPTTQLISYLLVTNMNRIVPSFSPKGPFLISSTPSAEFPCNIVWLFFNDLQPLFCTFLLFSRLEAFVFNIFQSLFCKKGGMALTIQENPKWLREDLKLQSKSR